MSFIAEYELSSPIMRKTAQAVPNMVFQTEDLHLAGNAKFVFWASGDDFDQFESAVVNDPTVADYTLLTEVDDRRLYRVTLTDEGKQSMTYPDATEYDIVFLDVRATNEGSKIRARVPSREALKAFREACLEREIPFRLDRLYREESDDPTNRYGLTPAQRDVLIRAHAQGYFNEPRSLTLEELAEEFDVTPSALRRRMRRGLDTLIERTLRGGT